MPEEKKPRIAVLTNTARSSLGEFLRRNLAQVFAATVAVDNYYFDALPSQEPVRGDVILVMSKGRALAARRHVAAGQPILVVERTIPKGELYKIFSIPAHTDVLVVNNDAETSLETAALLYQLGVDHLRLIPYEAGRDYRAVKVAITPGERDSVPADITTVIDVGHRCLDISTFIKIMHKLTLNSPEVHARLAAYAETATPLDKGINAQFKELCLRNNELDTVLNLSQEGILLLDLNGRIILANRSLREMFDLTGPLVGQTAAAVLPPAVRHILRLTPGQDEIVTYRSRTMVANRQDVRYFGDVARLCYNFKEVTYIRQLEQNLSRKLQERGLQARYCFDDLLTCAPQMRQCVALARKIAASDLTVLITGESGTGKELLAQSIHNASSRGKQPFVAINCAAIPQSLLESELFGYERGAFTGALREGKAGLFEQAHNGTVFLDEIGDMPPELQARLLRVLQERQIMRVGSRRVINVNIRVIAATNQNLPEKMRQGQFREDLYYRLNVMPVRMPPLRERQEDIVFLLRHFLKDSGQERIITSAAQDILLRYAWPGNVRELSNVAAYIRCTAADAAVTPQDLPYYLQERQDDFGPVQTMLAAKCRWASVQAVLQAVGELEATQAGAGRKSIEEYLAARGTRLSEGEVRRVLSFLRDATLVVAHTGRHGSALTARGRRFINWYQNR